MGYQLTYGCITHTGYARKQNQDNFICCGQFLEADHGSMDTPLRGVRTSRDLCLFGVFDGMGGEEQGGMAAYLAARCAAGFSSGDDIVMDLSRLCQEANRDICAYRDANRVSAMGTTAAMLAFTPGMVTLCNIGDTKILRLSGGTMEQISKDHVSVAAFGVKPPLLQNLGVSPSQQLLEPYFAQGACQTGDAYLICSDGLTDMVPAAQIKEIVTSRSLEEALMELVSAALAHGGRDNITAILCKINRQAGGLFHRLRRKGAIYANERPYDLKTDMAGMAGGSRAHRRGYLWDGLQSGPGRSLRGNQGDSRPAPYGRGGFSALGGPGYGPDQDLFAVRAPRFHP